MRYARSLIIREKTPTQTAEEEDTSSTWGEIKLEEVDRMRSVLSKEMMDFLSYSLEGETSSAGDLYWNMEKWSPPSPISPLLSLLPPTSVNWSLSSAPYTPSHPWQVLRNPSLQYLRDPSASFHPYCHSFHQATYIYLRDPLTGFLASSLSFLKLFSPKQPARSPKL